MLEKEEKKINCKLMLSDTLLKFSKITTIVWKLEVL